MTELEPVPWERVGDAKPPERAGMTVDLRRCVGCHACSIACKVEHDVPLGDFRMRVRYLEDASRGTIAFLPLLCMHCADAPCLDACPTSAIVRLDDGRVIVDEDRCCGNKACVSACPYGAIFVHPDRGVAEKCDFCTHRTEVGLDPACVSACPTDALRFGPAEGDAAAFREDEATAPIVRYVGLRPGLDEQANAGVRLDPRDRDIVYE